MRLIFAGTPDFARVALERLNAAGFEIALVLTQPDRPAGRGMKLQASPVKQFGLEHNIAIAQPRSLRLDGKYPEDAQAARAVIEAANADVMVVAAYGLILPQWVLDMPRLGCLNIHASLLPRWRGAAPIHRAIEAGDSETGVTIMQMDAGLDTGDMLRVERVAIAPMDTTGSLHDRLATLGGRMIVEALELAARGALAPVKQPQHGVTYAHKIEKAQAQVDWSQPAEVIGRLIRAFDPFPGAHTAIGTEAVKLWGYEIDSTKQPADAGPGTILLVNEGGVTVSCGNGALRLTSLQRAGGKRLAAADFLRGFELKAGMVFGAPDAARPSKIAGSPPPGLRPMNVLRFSDLCAQGKVAGQRVFIRADLNVPQDDSGRITEDTRIRASIPCIRMALDAGAAVMVTSHLGRPTEGEFKPGDSLAPVARRLGELLGQQVPLVANWVDGVDVKTGQLVLLENCRLNKGEKRNDPVLAAKMAALCDIFVHDAFGTAHRAEASTYGIAQFAKIACAGPLLAAEIDAITKALANPKRPLVAIVAGSKVSTKLTILKSLADKVDQLIVGGGIANTFMLAAGLKIGKSLVEADLIGQAKAVIDAMKARGAEVPIPTDVVTAKVFAADSPATVKRAAEVEDDDLILDIGPETAKRLATQLMSAGTIVWNGPVGVFEFAAFAHGTETIARAIAQSPAFSIAGGGDTLAAIAKYGIEKDVDYISTGGGAFLEVLEGKTLPAFEILEKRAGG